MVSRLIGVMLVFGGCLMLRSTGGSKINVDNVDFQYYDYYVLLASDIQEYHAASSVFIIFSGNDESLWVTTLLLHLHRKFSRKQVLSLTANFTDIVDYSKKIYYKRIKQPLFVVWLSSAHDVRTFQQVTRIYDMSYPTWLVIFVDPSSIRQCHRPTGNMFNLKFNTKMLVKCHGSVDLHEWYGMSETETEVNHLGLWDPIRHFQLRTNKSLYERRYHIGGKIMRVATIKGSPFITSPSGRMKGAFIYILNELAYAMNFTYDHTYKEEAYGVWNRTTRSWTGVIGRLARREADLGVGEFTMTDHRLNVVDFTLPIIHSRNLVYMRPPDHSAVHWSAYYRAFGIELGKYFVLVYLVSALIIIIVRIVIKETPIPFGYVSESFLWVLGIFCHQGCCDSPSVWSLRIAYFSLFASSVILSCIYSASLISYLTIAIPSLPFIDLEGFVKEKSYKLYAFRGSSDYEVFANTKDSMMKKMYARMASKAELPTTMLAGMQKVVCLEKGAAFYVTETVKNQLASILPCELVSIDTGRIDSLSMVLTKGSPYAGVINYHLQKFKDCGIMTRVRQKFVYRIDSIDILHEPVSLRGIIPILTFLFIGILLGLSVLFYEKLFYHIKRHLSRDKA